MTYSRGVWNCWNHFWAYLHQNNCHFHVFLNKNLIFRDSTETLFMSDVQDTNYRQGFQNPNNYYYKDQSTKPAKMSPFSKNNLCYLQNYREEQFNHAQREFKKKSRRIAIKSLPAGLSSWQINELLQKY